MRVPTIGITEKTPLSIYEEDLKGPIALVFGSEDVGISGGMLKIIDRKAKIPMIEGIDSLNVSVALRRCFL